MKRRKNGTGSAVYLGKGRYNPWAARIVIGKDNNGKTIYYDIDTFKEELDAIVCLENYHKNPTPLKIKEEKYNRIVTFSSNSYPLVPVKNIKASIHRKNKKNYTFKQVFEEMKNILFPTKEEIKLEKEKHIRTKGKFGCSNASSMITGYNHSKELYDIIYRELRTSDFQTFLNDCGKTPSNIKSMIKLYRNMDKYAYQEDIIDKQYTTGIKFEDLGNKSIREPFSFEQIDYLWKMQAENEKEQFVRDFLLLAIYTGARADELLFVYTKDIYLDKNYFLAGLKTEAGIRREIPIHPRIKYIIEKYYNKNNEFLFMKNNTDRLLYKTYQFYYNYYFKEKHPFLNGKTPHCGRHSLETELQRLNIKQTIVNSIIGHKNGDVGSDVYNHISVEEKIDAIKLVTYKKTKIYELKTS